MLLNPKKTTQTFAPTSATTFVGAAIPLDNYSEGSLQFIPTAEVAKGTLEVDCTVQFSNDGTTWFASAVTFDENAIYSASLCHLVEVPTNAAFVRISMLVGVYMAGHTFSAVWVYKK